MNFGDLSAVSPAQWATIIPALTFSSVVLLIYGLQQALDRRAARLRGHLERFTPRPMLPSEAEARSILRGRRRFSTIGTFDRFLHRQTFAERMAGDLARAALPLRVGEYLFIRWAIAVGCGGLANLAVARATGQAGANLPLAIVAGVIGYSLPNFYVQFRQRARLSRLNEQLVDALALIAGGLRAGYSFLQGIEAVVRELPPPIGTEFRLVLEDLSLGASLEDALQNLSRRAPLDDLEIVVTAMVIQRTAGGNLSEILDNISQTVRDRIRIRREVRTLTAQQRLSCYVVGALPFAAIGLLSFSNPAYLQVLFGTPHGQVMLGAAAVLEVIGFLLMRRIIDVRW